MFDVAVVRDEVNVVHVRRGVCRCVEGGAQMVLRGGEGHVECQGECRCCEGASHGYPFVGRERLCVVRGDTTVVGGSGSDPWLDEWR